MKTDFTFDGFEPANTTPVPDVLFDELLSELSESELKVLLYIIRRTAGFKKPTDAISLTQFQKGIKKRATGEILDKGCGVKDRATIVKALASLEKKRCIQSTKTDDPAGDRATSSYRILFRSEVVGKTNHPVDIGSGQNQPPWFAKPTTVVGIADYGVVGDSNPQETVIQETDLQQTDVQEGTGAFAPTPALSSLSQQVEKLIDTAHRMQAIRPPVVSQVVRDVEQLIDQYDAEDEEDELEKTVKRPAIRIATATQEPTPAQQSCSGFPSTTRAAPAHSAGNPSPSLPASTTSGLRAGAVSALQASSQHRPASARSFTPPSRPQRHQNERPQLTLEGEQVKSWLEIIQASTISRSYGNIRACNKLGENPDVSFESLKITIEHIESLKYVKDNDIPIDVQRLASDDKLHLDFEKNWPVARKKSRKAPEEDDQYSFAAILKRQAEQERTRIRGNR